MDIRADHRPISVRLEERSTPEPNTGCLLWYGCRTKAGYGKLGVDGGEVYVHRLAYELEHGPIPDGLLVCHTCDTPNCINPDHLFLGTNAENLADRDAKGRGDTKSWTMLGTKHHNARLTDDDVRYIRANCTKRGDQRRMAKQFGITETNVTVIVKRRGWKHVV
jgi:hypothetical protein